MLWACRQWSVDICFQCWPYSHRMQSKMHGFLHFAVTSTVSLVPNVCGASACQRVIPDSPACLHWDAHLGCFFCTFLHSLKISFCLSQPSAFQLCKSNSGSSMSLWVHMTNSYSSWVRITELGFIGSGAADWCCHLPLRKAILDCPWTKWDQRIPWFSFSAKLLPYLDAESS